MFLQAATNCFRFYASIPKVFLSHFSNYRLQESSAYPDEFDSRVVNLFFDAFDLLFARNKRVDLRLDSTDLFVTVTDHLVNVLPVSDDRFLEARHVVTLVVLEGAEDTDAHLAGLAVEPDCLSLVFLAFDVLLDLDVE